MRARFLFVFGVLSVAVTALISPAACGAAETIKVLVDGGSPDAAGRFVPNSPSVIVASAGDPAAPGTSVTIPLGGKEGYPGVNLKPASGAAFDLSAFGHVEARITNTGTKVLTFCLRVDNAGDWKDNPWNSENITLQPGVTGTAKVYFGYSFGKPGYALKSAEVTGILLFAAKSDVQQAFRIVSVTAAGTPGERPAVDPNSIRVRPAAGQLLGPGVAFDAGKQLTAAGGAKFSQDGQTLRVEFPAGRAPASVTLKPTQGRWDLRDCLEVRVKLRNDGTAPVTPSIRVDSNGGTGVPATVAPLAPGATAEVVVPFTLAQAANLVKNDTVNHLTSDAVSGVLVSAEPASDARSVVVESVRAGRPPTPALPDWLGKRPPVEGDWVKSYDDEFDGGAIDLTHWNVHGHNWWDPKKTHWTQEEVILGGGVARMRYEKKTGRQNDDPAGLETPYAAGYLDTYDKWTQRYGYFESRMKLPTSPGLWPAFWLVPDRGPAVGEARSSTRDGGMEFDIMEHLTRWGQMRYNVAQHWDGYDKDHKSNGSDHNYVQPDRDGYITCGLLWLPGQATYYCNGKEIARWDDPRVANVPAYIIYNMPSGGWDNDSLDDAKLPADFVIDYVRVWQRKDLASPVDRSPTAANVTAR